MIINSLAAEILLFQAFFKFNLLGICQSTLSNELHHTRILSVKNLYVGCLWRSP